jgi:hypothetical protein
MRIALCLSGQPRCLDECFDSLREFVIDPSDCDVFFHFWNTSSLPFTPDIIKMIYGTESVPSWKAFDDEYALKYINLLKPKRFIVEPQKLINDDYFRKLCTPENSRMQAKTFLHVLSMYYSIFMANQCRNEWQEAHGFKYDVVIRCRTDLKFFKTPDIDNIFNKIYIPEHDCYGGLNDQFAIGNGNDMHHYADCFLYLQILFANGTNFHPETLLRDHVATAQIPVKFISKCYDLVR